jgi:hypothetical protein
MLADGDMLADGVELGGSAHPARPNAIPSVVNEVITRFITVFFQVRLLGASAIINQMMMYLPQRGFDMTCGHQIPLGMAPTDIAPGFFVYILKTSKLPKNGKPTTSTDLGRRACFE